MKAGDLIIPEPKRWIAGTPGTEFGMIVAETPVEFQVIWKNGQISYYSKDYCKKEYKVVK